MSVKDEPIIHSKKPLTEHLSNLNFILGMVSIIVFILALFFKSTPAQGQAGEFFLDDKLITTLCLVINIISSITIVVVSFMYHKNFMRYHYRAIFGFFLALLPIVLTALSIK